MEYVSKEFVTKLVADLVGDTKKAEELLSSAPAMSVRFGKWLETPYTDHGAPVFACSECKDTVSDVPTKNGRPIYSLCPSCGAIMDRRKR